MYYNKESTVTSDSTDIATSERRNVGFWSGGGFFLPITQLLSCLQQ